MQIMTPAQCRAARALLNWSQPELAERCDIHVQTISNFEKESGSPSKTTLEKISLVFESSNIQFIEQDGVRLKTSSLTHYAGQAGYHEFYEDVYKTTRDNGSDIQVANVDEILFTDWLGIDIALKHKQRMHDLWKETPFTFQILVEEGDTDLGIAEIAQYKWTQKSRFADIPFYIYGQKLAIILFEDSDVNVYVINNPKIADAYRRQFKVLWDQGIPIPPELHKNIDKFTV